MTLHLKLHAVFLCSLDRRNGVFDRSSGFSYTPLACSLYTMSTLCYTDDQVKMPWNCLLSLLYNMQVHKHDLPEPPPQSSKAASITQYSKIDSISPPTTTK